MKQLGRSIRQRLFFTSFWLLKAIIAYIFLGNICVADEVDLCSDIRSRSIEIVGNGYKGIIHQYMRTSPIEGGYKFKTIAEFEGEPEDTIEGKCTNNYLVLIRKRPGVFTQKYRGWLFRKKTKRVLYQPNPMQRGKCYKTEGFYREVAGEFSHNGKKRYGWYGTFGPVPPR